MRTQERLLYHWLCLQVISVVVFSDIWKAEVETEMKALVSSCVVLPCKFNYPNKQLPDSRLRGIWQKKDGKENIYHEDSLNIADSFKGRTKLLGRLGEKNCTLEIDEVKDHDNGPFCFRTEIPGLDKYSFVDNCVSITMIVNPEKPEIKRSEYLRVGIPTTLKCFIKHTCPSHAPSLTWSRLDSQALKNSRYLSKGEWEVETLLTFIPAEQDDHTEISCTANFYGGKNSITTDRLYVKREKNYFHIIIPVVAVVGTAFLFGGVCFFVTKKYKRQIEELQSRNEHGMLGRLSRMSRRSYRRSEPTMHMNKKVELSAQVKEHETHLNRSNNHVSTVSSSGEFSKPRFPSPKSEHKSYSKSGGSCTPNYDDDDYTNVGDMNVYGNY